MNFTAASLRNRGPILEVLRRLPIPSSQYATHALEIAGGAGAHLAVNAPAFPNLTWHPTDLDGSDFDVSATSPSNVVMPHTLDVSKPVEQWPTEITKYAGQFTLVFCVNMLHISPWESTVGLFAGSQAMLDRNGLLVIYGPFFEDGNVTVASNIQFDGSLRLNDPRWGIRRLESVTELAMKHEFQLLHRFEMPANNLAVVYVKAEGM